MSEAVRELVEASHYAFEVLARHIRRDDDGSSLGDILVVHKLRLAIAAVEAELNAVPAVTDKQGFDGRSTDYPDWVENYR